MTVAGEAEDVNTVSPILKAIVTPLPPKPWRSYLNPTICEKLLQHSVITHFFPTLLGTSCLPFSGIQGANSKKSKEFRPNTEESVKSLGDKPLGGIMVWEACRMRY